MSNDLAVDEVLQILSFCRDTGQFHWSVDRSRTAKAGQVAGCADKDGYLRITIKGRKYAAHRLAWLLESGCWPCGEIDHINGVRSDNRPINLRPSDRAGNTQNIRGPRTNNTTGYLGVCRRGKRFSAEIRANGQRLKLGLFESPLAAHSAYVEAKKRLHPGWSFA